MSKCSKCLPPSDSETHTTLPSVPVWTECEVCGVLYESDDDGIPISGSSVGGRASSAIDRAAIRKMVQRQHDSLVKMSASGQNVHQRSIDYHDWLDGVFTAGMSPDEKAEFYDIYAEETQALSSHLADQPIPQASPIDALLEEKEREEKGLSTFIFGAVIIAIAAYLIYKFASP